jgi:hypothetical protein
MGVSEPMTCECGTASWCIAELHCLPVKTTYELLNDRLVHDDAIATRHFELRIRRAVVVPQSGGPRGYAA